MDQQNIFAARDQMIQWKNVAARDQKGQWKYVAARDIMDQQNIFAVRDQIAINMWPLWGQDIV